MSPTGCPTAQSKTVGEIHPPYLLLKQTECHRIVATCATRQRGSEKKGNPRLTMEPELG